jgi:ribose transport system ATP-binding protein
MTFGARVAAALARIRFRGVLPLVLMTTLIVAVGAYTALRQDAFLTNYNLNNLLLATMPLALVSLGQTSALLVGGFDVSVAALMTLCVVVASYTMTPTMSTGALIPGALLLVGVGLAVGIFNATLIRVFRLPSIIATIGTLSILEGASLWLRDHPEGSISSDAIDSLTTSWSFVPLAFIGVVILALLGDLWLYRSRTGMALRAVGLDETSSRRLGIRTDRVVILAFVACSVMASIAGFYLAAEVQIGSPIIGNFALESIAAGVLGGASLAGGRGSFFGTLLAALFLSLIDNVLPLFHQPTEYAEMTIGVLILVALILYQGPELIGRLRSSFGGVGRLRGSQGEAGEPGEAEAV